MIQNFHFPENGKFRVHEDGSLGTVQRSLRDVVVSMTGYEPDRIHLNFNLFVGDTPYGWGSVHVTEGNVDEVRGIVPCSEEAWATIKEVLWMRSTVIGKMSSALRGMA
jgi:hypothetical protein